MTTKPNTSATTLIIDNYDSFTYNLCQLFGALGANPQVVRNDEITIDDIHRLAPRRIVLSPGPGRPDDDARVGVCRQILEHAMFDDAVDRDGGPRLDVPILGVCLGHQAIVCAAGGRIVSAPRLMHGKTSIIDHEGDGILRDLPRPFEAMRYHSLTADRTALPDSLLVTAWCSDGTVMAIRHRAKSIFGVQFHPESIGTRDGPLLCRAFLEGL